MKTKFSKPTLTIGIPALNEESNIKLLLQNLLRQKIKKVTLKEIIVVSDGSTDKTVEKVDQVRNKIIKLIINKKIKGQAMTQNIIVKKSKSNILVLLNADILPTNNLFLESIVSPIIKDKNVGIVGADTIGAKPNSFLEKLIVDGREVKKSLYRKINNGNNIYHCHGRARAFSRKLYSQIKWPSDCPEDAYSYLFCLEKGMKFKFSPKAKVIFRSPSKFSDYVQKNTRFFRGKKNLEKHFSQEFLLVQFHIPLIIKLTTLAKFFFSRPFTTITYVALFIFARLLSSKNTSIYPIWNTSESTKSIIGEEHKQILKDKNHSPGEYLHRMFLNNSWARFVNEKEKKTVINLWGIENSKKNRLESILDLGIGAGRWSRLFVDKKFKKVVGLDINSEMVKYTSESISNKKFKGITANIRYMPFRNDSFYRVFCFRTFKYLGNSHASIKEIKRALKPGGYMLIEVPNNSIQIKIFTLINKIAKKIIPSFKLEANWYLENSKFYDKKEINQLILSNGLKLKRIYPLFSLPASSLPTVNGLLTNLWIFFDSLILNFMPKSLVARSWILLIEKKEEIIK